MSRILPVVVLILASGLLALSDGASVSAQDCEQSISGNTQSRCKRLDYLDSLQLPTFLVEQFTDDQGKYACRSFIEFKSDTPLQDHSLIAIGGSSEYSPIENNNALSWSIGSGYGSSREFKGWGSGSLWGESAYYNITGTGPWSSSGPAFVVGGDKVRARMDWATYPDSLVGQSPGVYRYLIVGVQFGKGRGEYVVVSDTFQLPTELNDYRLLMNHCLDGIVRQLEQEAALETARQQVEIDRVASETAAKEAGNQAEIAAIELQSAQDALKAQEALNAALLTETILSIKREDAIRAAWQQVILVRMAGLEERTILWNEAVERWATEDLQFSTAMEARIQEVKRLQALNAALEQSMADQRRLLIAQLEDLEKAEQEALDARNPATEPESGSQPGG